MYHKHPNANTDPRGKKTNIDAIKRIMSDKEIHIAFSQKLRQEDSQVRNQKVNDLLTNILTNDITELNDLIYAGVKLISEKIGVLLKTTDRKLRPGWELRF